MNGDLVLDASFTLASLFREVGSAMPLEYFQTLLIETVRVGGTVMAPAIWMPEVVNAMLLAVRSGQFDGAQFEQLVEDLSHLPVAVNEPAGRPEALFALARQQGLTAYDATYLELALRHQATLATFDAALQQAARRLGVPLLE